MNLFNSKLKSIVFKINALNVNDVIYYYNAVDPMDFSYQILLDSLI